jgi:hypothetical protein
VISLAVICPWLKWSYHHLGDQMNKHLHKNYERIMTKQRRKHNTSESDQLTLDQARIDFIVEQIIQLQTFLSLSSRQRNVGYEGSHHCHFSHQSRSRLAST